MKKSELYVEEIIWEDDKDSPFYVIYRMSNGEFWFVNIISLGEDIVLFKGKQFEPVKNFAEMYLAGESPTIVSFPSEDYKAFAIEKYVSVGSDIPHEYKSAILAHELAHIELGHTAYEAALLKEASPIERQEMKVSGPVLGKAYLEKHELKQEEEAWRRTADKMKKLGTWDADAEAAALKSMLHYYNKWKRNLSRDEREAAAVNFVRNLGPD